MLVTRIAPTPSGFLHVGNAVNIVLTDWMARAHGGQLLLRIDDFDTGRIRPAYLEDVFRTLDWLDIAIDDGPSGPADFQSRWSMSTRMDTFQQARDRLMGHAGAQVFVCRCSRTSLGPNGHCVRGCAGRDLDLVAGHSVLRMSVPTQDPRGEPPAGDHVLWRRDGLPAYHLGSVVADEALGVTAVVRGTDLRPSSALQVHLATLLPAPGFAAADLRHHDLLTGPGGAKLSKSAGTQALPMEHSIQLRERIWTCAEALGAPIGIHRP